MSNGKPIDGIDDKIVRKICSETYVKDNLKEIQIKYYQNFYQFF